MPNPAPPPSGSKPRRAKKVKPYKPGRSRASKAIGAIEGDDDFSVSAAKKHTQKPMVNMKPKLDEMPLPRDLAPPTRERNLFIRLFARIFR